MLRRLKRKEAPKTPPPVKTPPASEDRAEDHEDMKLFDREPDAPVPAAPLPAEPAPGIENGVATREDDAKMETKTETTRTTTPAVGSRETLSVIGKTLFVKGQIEAAEDMLVEGRLEGTVKHTADRLIIGVSGVVNADIDAKNLIIEGTVEGNIVGAESVVITDSADVRGNVYTARISIADGARFSGTVDMDISKSPKH
jgi:cytoskeletal protein CcmA (bactofilin family)